MDFRACLACLLCASLAACSTVGIGEDESLPEMGERLARTHCSNATPSVRNVPNSHIEGQLDRIEIRRCESGSAALYKGPTTSNPDGLALQVEITQPRAGLPSDLDVGSPVDRALERLGPALEQGAGFHRYALGEDGDRFTLHHAGGRITSVEWEWSID